MKVLVIEDDPVWSLLLKNELFKQNIDQLDFSTTALTILNRHEPVPDLIFIDFKLHDLNGARAARMIKRKWPKVVIVLISSSDGVKRISKKKFGLDLVFSKGHENVKEIVSCGLKRVRIRWFVRKLVPVTLVAAVLLVTYLFISGL